MMRALFLSFVLVVGCTPGAPSVSASVQAPRSLNSGLGTVVSVRPVHVAQGFRVWRDGSTLTVHDGLLIRLDGVSSGNFIDRAVTSPLFVLDDTIGMVVSRHLGPAPTFLLMHSPTSGTHASLWMTLPGVLPRSLSGGALVANRNEALSATSNRGLDLPIPSPRASRTTYATLDELRKETTFAIASQEVCAQANKDCGLVFSSPFGMLDCGGCGAGRVCNDENRCCPSGAGGCSPP